MKIYVIAAIHGNEKFGLKVLSHLDINSPNIRVRVGHPEAIAKNKRFIGSDLNRSFRDKANTTEARLAKSIEQEISSFAPNYVIDIHTSITDVGIVAIMAERNDKTELLAHTLGATNMVIMSPEFTKNSLIGCAPDRSISLELGRGLRSDNLARKIAQSITHLPEAKFDTKQKLPLFQVTSTIKKDYKHFDKLSNLKFSSHLNAYPFLASKNSYQNMGGFLAKKIS